MFETFRKLLDLLTPSERRRFYLLLGMIMVMGLAEMVSVASILPFLAVLADPGVIETSDRLAALYAAPRLRQHRERFLVFLGGAVFAGAVFGLLFSHLRPSTPSTASPSCAATRSAAACCCGYLHQPYTWFLNRHSAKLGATMLTEVNQVISQAMMPAMRMLSHGAVALFLVALLVVVQPLAALVLAVLLGGSYGLIYLGVRRQLARLGEARYAANQAALPASPARSWAASRTSSSWGSRRPTCAASRSRRWRWPNRRDAAR